MGKKFAGLSFYTKVLIVYICSLILAIVSITVNQTQTAADVLEEESTHNLKMLTEQVALNFGEHQETVGYSIYSRMAALEIPALMDSYNQNPSGTALNALRYSLVQMVTDSSEYNYVLLELADGTRINSGWKGIGENTNHSAVHTNCETILDENRIVTYGNSNWTRDSSGNVHIFRDVYTTSPLRRVGKAVFHMKENLFSVSDTFQNVGFLFFDAQEHYLFAAGMEIPEEKSWKSLTVFPMARFPTRAGGQNRIISRYPAAAADGLQ